ncbi:aldehyde oxidase GLOX1-like [Diospyros lotus]|uniref:aldehyde oxidase GLOX1-like n=1 Tax=Diospyros lotus TaxID=55363 RepID=UPI002257F6E8|nr:aldehyde oxidase GLOX1-like [Diospyros lotus]
MAPLLKALCLALFFVYDSAAFPSLLPGGGKGGLIPNGKAVFSVNFGLNDGDKSDYETGFRGAWKADNPNSGVSSMHLQLLPNNKFVWYDAVSLGPSNITLPEGDCRPIPGKPNQVDCWGHAVEYDIETKEIKPLKFMTDAWCSAGGLTPEGFLLSLGGFADGSNAVRILKLCENCRWKENAQGLARPRWYSTQEKLEDGSFVIFGGRREFNYEIVQSSLQFEKQLVDLPFIKETTDPFENNLYPFAFLLPDGTVFLLANNRSIILSPRSGQIVRELPVLPGGSRNYPGSGSAALLPLKISASKPFVTDAEVLVCGGGVHDGTQQAEKGNFMPAIQNCGRILATQPGAEWEMDMMPIRRTMADMLLLPNAEVLIINGATDGVSGWTLARNPTRKPLLYSPKKNLGERFTELAEARIPRMYHSSTAVMPDGNILVAGSNTNPRYLYKDVEFPTELRLERFAPPYLDPELDKYRPEIIEDSSDSKLVYGQIFKVKIKLDDNEAEEDDIKVTMLAPPFTTHGYSMNQRLVVIDPIRYSRGKVTLMAPSNGRIAPPGYYLLFVVNRGVPSRGMWVQIL